MVIVFMFFYLILINCQNFSCLFMSHLEKLPFRGSYAQANFVLFLFKGICTLKKLSRFSGLFKIMVLSCF